MDSTRVTFPRDSSSASIRAMSRDFTAGGGGYGPVEERPPELTDRDRRLGYVDATIV